MGFNRPRQRVQSTATTSRIADLHRQLVDLERRKTQELSRLRQQQQDVERRFNDELTRIRREIMRLEGISGFKF